MPIQEQFKEGVCMSPPHSPPFLCLKKKNSSAIIICVVCADGHDLLHFPLPRLFWFYKYLPVLCPPPSSVFACLLGAETPSFIDYSERMPSERFRETIFDVK